MTIEDNKDSDWTNFNVGIRDAIVSHIWKLNQAFDKIGVPIKRHMQRMFKCRTTISSLLENSFEDESNYDKLSICVEGTVYEICFHMCSIYILREYTENNSSIGTSEEADERVIVSFRVVRSGNSDKNKGYALVRLLSQGVYNNANNSCEFYNKYNPIYSDMTEVEYSDDPFFESLYLHP